MAKELLWALSEPNTTEKKTNSSESKQLLDLDNKQKLEIANVLAESIKSFDELRKEVKKDQEISKENNSEIITEDSEQKKEDNQEIMEEEITDNKEVLQKKEDIKKLIDDINKEYKNTNLKVDIEKQTLTFGATFKYMQWDAVINEYSVSLTKKDGKAVWKLSMPWRFNTKKYENPQDIKAIMADIQMTILQVEWRILGEDSQDTLRKKIRKITTVFQKAFPDKK